MTSETESEVRVLKTPKSISLGGVVKSPLTDFIYV